MQSEGQVMLEFIVALLRVLLTTLFVVVVVLGVFLLIVKVVL